MSTWCMGSTGCGCLSWCEVTSCVSPLSASRWFSVGACVNVLLLLTSCPNLCPSHVPTLPALLPPRVSLWSACQVMALPWAVSQRPSDSWGVSGPVCRAGGGGQGSQSSSELQTTKQTVCVCVHGQGCSGSGGSWPHTRGTTRAGTRSPWPTP